MNSIHLRTNKQLDTIYEWDRDADTLDPVAQEDMMCQVLASRYNTSADKMRKRWDEYSRQLKSLREEGVRDFDQVRARIVKDDFSAER